MVIVLRDYQNDMIAKVREAFKAGNRSVLMQMATGSGKTLTAAYIIKHAAEKGNSTLFLCNRRELVEQTVEAFASIGVNVGVIAAGTKPNWNLAVQVGSIDTLRARMDDTFYFPDLVIWDECRGIAAASWAKIREHYKDAYHIGLDATPKRLDRKPLRPYFEEMICGLTIGELIERGALVPPRVYSPREKVDLTGVKMSMGDFDAQSLAEVMGKSAITGDIIGHYQRLGVGRQGLTFCPTIEYSNMMVRLFNGAGIAAEHLDGNSSKKVRKKIVGKYRDGDLRMLSNVNLFTAGFDVPNVSYIADASPTMSLANYMQRAGRAARPAEGKEYYVLSDHAGNSFRHGLPHEDREWSLDAPPKRKKSAIIAAASKQCEECYAHSPISTKICPYCGTPFQVVDREVKQTDGELVEVQPLPKLIGAELREAIAAAQRPADLYALAKRQGYKAGWAWIELQKRRMPARNPMGDL